MDIKNTVDLSNLLTILRAHKVASFSAGNISLTFVPEEEEEEELIIEDDESEIDWRGVQVFE